MTGVQMLQSIIEILVGGITSVGSAIGQGLSTLAQSVFLTTTGTGADATTTLSTFGSLVVIFAAISLGCGLCRWIVNFVTSLGSRNR